MNLQTTIGHWNALPEDLMYGNNICTKFKENYENLVFKRYIHHKLSTILENTHTSAKMPNAEQRMVV